MKERTLQILRYLTLPCLFSCLSLVADEQEEGHMSSSQKSGGMTFCQTYDMLKTKEVTPYAGPVVDGGADVSMRAAYILWHASQGGLGYAYDGLVDPVGPRATAVRPKSDFSQSQGRVVKPSFKTSSGFKAALGIDFAYDGWDLDLAYTWLHTHARSSIDRDAGDVSGLLIPIHGKGFEIQAAGANVGWTQLAAGDTSIEVVNALFNGVQSAKSSWRLHFNVLDLELGRNFFISSKLLVRPHYGFKATWQKQNNLTNYYATGAANLITTTGGITNTATTTVVPQDRDVTIDSPTINILIEQLGQNYNIADYQYYWGFGPRTGMNLSWLMSRNFSFFTDASVSLLWGQFTNSRGDTLAATDLSTGAVVYENYNPANVRSRYHGINVVAEAQMGLRYDYWFSNDEYRFRAEAGWENQLWFNQNQMLNPGENSLGAGDLSLQGFTLTFQFDF